MKIRQLGTEFLHVVGETDLSLFEILQTRLHSTVNGNVR